MWDMITEIFTYNTILMLLRGAKITIYLSLMGIIGGTIIGLIGASLKTYNTKLLKPVQLLINIYTESMRRVPLLILLLLSYLFLSKVGMGDKNFIVASVAIIVYAGAYMVENIRSGIESLPKTQWDGAKALGLNQFEVIKSVIMPQALRVAIPPSLSFIQSLIKDTSMAVIIGLFELTKVGIILRYRFPMESFYIFLAIMIIYFFICFPIARLGDYFEGRFRKFESK